MNIGLHLSIAGGLDKALWRAQALGCSAVQIFLQNPRGWRWRPVSMAEAAKFRQARRETGIRRVVAHLSYLPNLAAADPDLYGKSVARLRAEFELAHHLGVDYFVCHPGHGPAADASFFQVAAALEAAAAGVPTPPQLLLENTAGQGTEIGWTVAQLQEIISRCKAPVGLCVDTAHAFAAGYNLRTPAGVTRLLREVAAGPGLATLKVVHLNETRHPRQSHRDRHWHLEQGAIGSPGLACFLRRVSGWVEAVILETPKKTPADDPRNLAIARGLAAEMEKPEDAEEGPGT